MCSQSVWLVVSPAGFFGNKGEKGSKGFFGDTGEEGLRGQPGEMGIIGETGPKGVPGDFGDEGRIGEKGEKGFVGVRGDRGPIGDIGLQGEQGLEGQKGERGFMGDQGEKGIDGIEGPSGETGFQGPKGQPGEQGQLGPEGELGSKGFPGSPVDDFFIVRHSQTQQIPPCPPGHTKLWDGWSLLYIRGNGYAAGQDLGDPGSCLRLYSPMPFMRCHSVGGFCQTSVHHDRSYWLATVTNVTRPMGSMPTATVVPHVSRCSVCTAPSEVIAIHSQESTVPNCYQGWTSLWDGYSFVQVSVTA